MDARLYWKPRLRILLTNLAERQREHLELANLSSQVAADYHGRFLIELLQNASDQAIGAPGAKVHVAWAPGILAVANQGAPFTADGLEAITSMALSPKKADEAIGHKGIGFKSVFEISAAPEIYSSVEPHGQASEGGSLRWCLSSAPFAQPRTLRSAVDLCREILKEDNKLSLEIQRRFGEGWELHVEQALRASAPFKYPLPLDEGQHRQRLRDLRLEEVASDYTTVIVLPLRRGAEAAVERALAELLDPAAAIVAFLPNISRIEISAWSDREELAAALWREDVSSRPCGAGRFVNRRCHRTVERGPSGAKASAPRLGLLKQISAGRTHQAWWVLESSLGAMSEERLALKEATHALQGDAWRHLERLPVRVGLPHPDGEDLEFPFGGRFVTGLPTQVSTGSPLWVDSLFVTTISRTGLDLSSPLNALAFDHAKATTVHLLEQLRAEARSSGEVAPLAGLAVALVFTTKEGPLGAWLRSEEGPAQDPVVLMPDGRSFKRARQLRLPRKEDLKILQSLQPDLAAPELVEAGYILPHAALLTRCHGLLKELGAKLAAAEGGTLPFLARSTGPSLVERWAHRLRHEGPSRWETFLRWLCAGSDRAQLMPLEILPVGEDGLAAPQEGVYIPLQADPRPHSGEPSLAEVPPEVGRLLTFLDGAAVQVTQADGALTPLGLVLQGRAAPRYTWGSAGPEGGEATPLVRTPTISKLLEGALPRALAEAQRRGGTRDALRLLLLGLKWRLRAEAGAPSREWVIPAADQQWRRVSELALGEGWSGEDAEEDEALLSSLYPGPDQRTIGWREFAQLTGAGEADRVKLADALSALGVARCPRVKEFPSQVVLTLGAGKTHAIAARCPVPGMEASWAAWLGDVAQTCAHHKYGGVVKLSPVWIDGLESPRTAAAVARWLLREERIPEASTAFSSGSPQWLRMNFPAWWIFRLQELELDKIPTSEESWSQGRALPAWEVCTLSEEERRSGALRLLPHLPEADATPLGAALGVVAFKSADAAWLIARLADLNTELTEGRLAPRGQAEALVMRLYERLDESTGTDGLPDSIKETTLPIWRGEGLSSMRLGEEAMLYVEDEPYRTRYIPNYAQRPHLRVRPGTDYSKLIPALRTTLGVAAVLTTREATVDVPFTPEGEPAEPLVPWLTARCGRSDLPALMATLLVYGRQGKGEVHSYHHDAWARLTRARVAFGAFSDGAWSFYDAGADTLMVASELREDPFTVLAESWQAPGGLWHEVWEVFASRVAQGEERLRRYLREKRIGEGEFDKVREVFRLESAAEGDLDSARVHHGKVLKYSWTSRKGYRYPVNRWSCCGQYEGHRECTRVPGRFHPGRLTAGGSRSGGGNGSDCWTCCWKWPTAPGCTDEGAEVETSG